ncbi:cationic amino acid transporter 1-like [Aristolochia californica]|uniref:cationic amino acid transporter 1-like n=1 Tax=Aristolochia californica TaxID=171875 RepID=UPI0035E0AC67
MTEVTEVKARSQHEMKKTLNWWDILWFGLGAVIGAGIFVLTGIEAQDDAGPAVVISYLFSGVSAMLSVLCYTEFAVEIPVAGGSFAYLRVELGDSMAFIAAGNILLEYLVSGAAVARAWTSYFATLINRHPDDLRIIVPSLAENFNHLDPIAVVVLIVIGAGAIFSTKASSRFNYVVSILQVFIILFVIIAGLTHSDPSNLSDFAPYGPRGIFKASAVLFFAYVGFDAVATLAEETKNPGRDIPIGLIGSMSIVTVLYCVMAITLCMMQSYKTIDANAPFSMAFEAVGMKWAKYIVALGALKGMTTVLLSSAIGQARYVTHIARTHMLPPCLAAVHKDTKTPVAATVMMIVGICIFAFFTDLDILSNLLSIATLFIFTLVAIALLIRRYYLAGETSVTDRNKLIGFLVVIIASSLGLAAGWAENVKGWALYAVTCGIWFLGTLGLQLLLKKARAPRLWGAPLVPWLPSASVAINIFLLGSIDRASFVRFGVWTAILLVYYLLFGLHASYDTAMAIARDANPTERVVEEGVAAHAEENRSEIS